MINVEVLQAARGMSVAMLSTWLALGLAVWLFGWRWHRFWITSAAVIAAAAITWQCGNIWTQTPPVIAVIVVALAAAVVAVELARLVVFVLGGAILLYLTSQHLPEFHDTWLAFPLGGLVAVLLFRLGWIIITSLLGTLIATHAILLLVEPIATFDSVQWSRDNSLSIHIGMCIWIIVGITGQIWMNRRVDRLESSESYEATHIPVLIPVQNHPSSSLWNKWFSKNQPVVKI
jgi:hypothetical protein